MATGYSGTPILKKLGFKAPMELVVLDAPTDYASLVGELPPGMRLSPAVGSSTDVVHLFATSRATLSAYLDSLRRMLPDHAALWVSWPKKASRVPADITEDTIRELALPLGFVDIKVCAVSEVWSGLKLVVRRELRGRSST